MTQTFGHASLLAVLAAALTMSVGCGRSADSTDAGAAEPAAPAPTWRVASGTQIELTLDQTLTTESNASGDTFSATVAGAITRGERVLIPAGARVHGAVTAVQQATAEQPIVQAKPRDLPAGEHWFWGLGRRKTSVARVRIRPGSGRFLINGRPTCAGGSGRGAGSRACCSTPGWCRASSTI